MENRSAAGLRRSAIAERLRLREEWSALKEINEEPITSSRKNALTKKQPNTKSNKIFKERTRTRSRVPGKENSQTSSQITTSDVLRGVVVLVEVGSESRALALRAALSALGATVVPAWSPLVTHLVWSEGGCRSVRARARALAAHVVSPLWVEGCAGGRRLPERLFPAPPRPSDLPSPATLRRMLVRAERENIPLANLLSDSPEPAKRLRVSDETDTSRDTSKDTSRDKSDDTPGEAVRVNTAPRRALPMSTSPEPTGKSRRKLFTNRELDGTTEAESEEDKTPAPKQTKMTPRQRKELATAERMARRLLARGTPKHRQTDTAMRIVVTGMSRTERRIITKAIKQLNGVVHSKVDKKTDCVVLGSCSTQCPENLADLFTEQLNINKGITNISGVCEMNVKNVCRKDILMPKKPEAELRTIDLIQEQVQNENRRSELAQLQNIRLELTPGAVLTQSGVISPEKPRTVNALLGAVRGCRVLGAAWVLDSVRQNRWIHHVGYEVKHLMKISQKARVERSALGRMKREYAYNIFRGMSVHVTRDAEQRVAILQLLTMCGAVLTDKPSCKTGMTQVGGTQNVRYGPTFNYMTQNGGFQNGGLTQNGIQDGADITIGVNTGEICSKWVFDSIAAARMRTVRRYINI
ncbi:uncharacterized protein LOC121735963 [Aricia agestis]|uniref:uncharacterized protein LOC121735963 n=1 Tax=Aricia agestis TaxID=91739 RepID=UPI001C201BEE|nr:uncharacterized protein LOC121735963 [Aricia agestis]